VAFCQTKLMHFRRQHCHTNNYKNNKLTMKRCDWWHYLRSENCVEIERKKCALAPARKRGCWRGVLCEFCCGVTLLCCLCVSCSASWGVACHLASGLFNYRHHARPLTRADTDTPTLLHLHLLHNHLQNLRKVCPVPNSWLYDYPCTTSLPPFSSCPFINFHLQESHAP